MKKLVLVLCVFMLPLTLASDTQHRFKVYVVVTGDDEQAVNTIEIHLKRELRLLGDVDVVSRDNHWEYIIEIFCIALERQDGTKTGYFSIASREAVRLPESLYSNPLSYKVFQGTWAGVLGAAYYLRENLNEFSIIVVGKFDKRVLQAVRDLR